MEGVGAGGRRWEAAKGLRAGARRQKAKGRVIAACAQVSEDWRMQGGRVHMWQELGVQGGCARLSHRWSELGGSREGVRSMRTGSHSRGDAGKVCAAYAEVVGSLRSNPGSLRRGGRSPRGCKEGVRSLRKGGRSPAGAGRRAHSAQR